MIIGIIIMILLIVIFIVGIIAINNNIDEFNNSESSICPRFYCEQTPCINADSKNTIGSVGSRTAFRYEGDKLQCQTYVMDSNVIN